MFRKKQLKESDYSLPRLSKCTRFDYVILAWFVLFSLFYCIARSAWVPLSLVKTGDAANIASFAAAWDYPELFNGDGLLGNPDNFRFYATIHIPLLQVLALVTGGYGLAFSYLLGLHVFLQLLGFYILGRVIFRNRYWAILLAIINLIPVALNLGTSWGVFSDAIPRFSFQVLLPFLLSAVYYLRMDYKVWPWLMMFAGVLIYVHPVSAPGWAFAVWLSLWLFLPKSYTLQQKITYMIFVGSVCVAVVLPFAVHYLANHDHGAVESYEQVYEIMQSRFASGFLDIPMATKQFFSIIQKKYLLTTSVISLIFVLILHRHRRDVFLVCLWIIGLLLFNILCPYLGHKIAQAKGEIPAQIDLIRGIRYLVPLMLLFCLWSLTELSRRFRTHHRKIALFGALFVAFWVYSHPIDFISKVAPCWQKGRFECVPDRISLTAGLLDALPEVVPPASPILVAPSAVISSLSIRYYSLRPVVYTPKDGGALAYANHTELLKWDKVRSTMDLISQESNPEDELKMLSESSCDLDAKYLLTSKMVIKNGQIIPRPFPHKSFFELLNLEEVYSNSMFSLLKVEDYCTSRN